MSDRPGFVECVSLSIVTSVLAALPFAAVGTEAFLRRAGTERCAYWLWPLVFLLAFVGLTVALCSLTSFGSEKCLTQEPFSPGFGFTQKASSGGKK
jgi:hypothetical protein